MKSYSSQFSKRINDVRGMLEKWEVDAILIGSTANRRWLSGFTGTAGWLLISEKSALLGTDSRYWGQASSQAPDFNLEQFLGNQKEEWPGFLLRDNINRIGLETEKITLTQYAEFQDIDGVEWVKLEDAVTPFRIAKNEEEIERIKTAAAITDQAMAQVHSIIKAGMSERELAWKLEVLMREAGADGMAFPIIVASGPNGAMAHHNPSDKAIMVGEAVIVDMGARVNGYNSDLTRTFFMGKGPDSRFSEIYDIVFKAHQTSIAGLKAGVTGENVDALARDVITNAGYGKEFGHSLGHGIGINVHERPRLSRLAIDETVPAGAAVTIEPGIYIAGWGGIRIEDLLVVTSDGCEYVSHCEKNPFIA
jgi:Xaa-Pro aminopeptidase